MWLAPDIVPVKDGVNRLVSLIFQGAKISGVTNVPRGTICDLQSSCRSLRFSFRRQKAGDEVG